VRCREIRTVDSGVDDPGKYGGEDEGDSLLARQSPTQQYIDGIESRNVGLLAEFDVIKKSVEQTLCSDFLVLFTCNGKPREQKGRWCRALFQHPVVLLKFVHVREIRREFPTARHTNGHLENELEAEYRSVQRSKKFI